MKRAINLSMYNKILLPIFIIAILFSIFLYFFIPKTIEDSLVKNIVQNSKLIAKRLQLQREYYVKSVVADVQKYAKELKFSYSHEGVDGVLPFPTTVIHDLSKLYSDNGDVKISLYSQYPFLNRKNRVLSKKQIEILKSVKRSKDGIYYKKDIINNVEVLRVGIADKMHLQACINCHNNHTLKNWNFKWKLGDTRGVLEIITPIKSAIGDINEARNTIVWIVIVLILFLVVYYSFILLKREEEVLKEKNNLTKDYDAQLAIQARSAQMGEMIANIAHQWRQPLSIISTATSSLEVQKQMNILDDDKFDELCETIRRNSKYLSSTIDDFRGFIKGSKEKNHFILSNNINTFLHLVDSNKKSNHINVILDLDNNIKLYSYSNELIQCYINIFNNSVDVIKTLDFKNRNIFITTKLINNNAVIIIKDSGGGISKDIIEKIFDPYFTTKHKSQGTGLGLHMTYEMITHKINGTISVKNETYKYNNLEYKGAVFTITIPIQ